MPAPTGPNLVRDTSSMTGQLFPAEEAGPAQWVSLSVRARTAPCTDCGEPMCSVTRIVDRVGATGVAVDTAATAAFASAMLNRAGLHAVAEQLDTDQSGLYDPNTCGVCGHGEPWDHTHNDYFDPLVLACDEETTRANWTALVAAWQTTPVRVAVFAHPSTCTTCRAERIWVTGLRPWPTHVPGDFVQADQPTVVNLLRAGLQRANLPSLADQLRKRPPGLRGASYNANACRTCGALEGWHDFQAVVDDFWTQQGGEPHTARIASGTITRNDWAKIINERHFVWC